MKKINIFWNWFQDNNQTIKNLINETPKNQKHISFWINKNLNYYCKEIDFMIVFPKKGSTKSEFIITTKGNLEYFKAATELIDNAPVLKKWKFSAFIKPTNDLKIFFDKLDEPFIFNDITIKACETKFLPICCNKSYDKFNIIVYLNNDNILCNTHNWKEALYIIMQHQFREKYSFQNINFVQLAQPNPDNYWDDRKKETPDNNQKLIHLYELQYYIDELNK